MRLNNFFFRFLAILSVAFGVSLYLGYLILKLSEMNNDRIIIYRDIVYITFVISLSAIIFCTVMLGYFLSRKIEYDKRFVLVFLLGAFLLIIGAFFDPGGVFNWIMD